MSQILKQQLLRLNWFKETLMSAAMSRESRERLIKKVGDSLEMKKVIQNAVRASRFFNMQHVPKRLQERCHGAFFVR
jgi:hypothetical protein